MAALPQRLAALARLVILRARKVKTSFKRGFLSQNAH